MKPVFDVLKTYQIAKGEILQAIERVLESGSYILGEEVRKFELEFARATENKWAVGVASGTDAITLALMALGVGPGDEVIVPSFTAYPTIVGVVRSGAKPVAVDVGNNGLMDPRNIERALTIRAKAVVPVHLFGLECDMASIMKIARENNLKVVEDCAQHAFKKLEGDAGAYSFYPTKTLGCFGDGGAVGVNDSKLARKVKRLRDYGQSRKNVFTYQGLNSRLDEIQAAILRAKLKAKAFMEPAFYKVSSVRDQKIREENKKGKSVLIHYPYIISGQKAFQGRAEGSKKAKNLSETIYTVSRN